MLVLVLNLSFSLELLLLLWFRHLIVHCILLFSFIFLIKVNELFSFFSSWCFLKEVGNTYFVFLSSYRSTCTHESLGELKKAVETLSSSSRGISRSPKLPLMFLNLIETRYIFSIF